MHTHHSHSGQFCQHAKNTLEEMVLKAIEMKFELICLTEHMPRLESKHLYPEELASSTTIDDLFSTFEQYLNEAWRLQDKYRDQIDILVGFESESINHEYMKQVELLISQYRPDMFVGSLHHSDDVPIDFDKAEFERALKDTANNNMDTLALKYFIQLHGMIARLRPPVIGHYDLIRLFAEDYKVKDSRAWPHILRTIKLAVRADCLFEVNSSAFRKGWLEAYPQNDILEEIIKQGGKLCLSDDSHNTDQIGLNYGRVYEYLSKSGVNEVWRLKRTHSGVEQVPVPLTKLKDWLQSI